MERERVKRESTRSCQIDPAPQIGPAPKGFHLLVQALAFLVEVPPHKIGPASQSRLHPQPGPAHNEGLPHKTGPAHTGFHLLVQTLSKLMPLVLRPHPPKVSAYWFKLSAYPGTGF